MLMLTTLEISILSGVGVTAVLGATVVELLSTREAPASSEGFPLAGLKAVYGSTLLFDLFSLKYLPAAQ